MTLEINPQENTSQKSSKLYIHVLHTMIKWG